MELNIFLHKHHNIVWGIGLHSRIFAIDGTFSCRRKELAADIVVGVEGSHKDAIGIILTELREKYKSLVKKDAWGTVGPAGWKLCRRRKKSIDQKILMMWTMVFLTTRNRNYDKKFSSSNRIAHG